MFSFRLAVTNQEALKNLAKRVSGQKSSLARCFSLTIVQEFGPNPPWGDGAAVLCGQLLKGSWSMASKAYGP